MTQTYYVFGYYKRRGLSTDQRFVTKVTNDTSWKEAWTEAAPAIRRDFNKGDPYDEVTYSMWVGGDEQGGGEQVWTSTMSVPIPF